MLKRLANKLLITPDDIEPSDPRLKVIGVFNPGVARYQDEIILVIRVAEAALLHNWPVMVGVGTMAHGTQRLSTLPLH